MNKERDTIEKILNIIDAEVWAYCTGLERRPTAGAENMESAQKRGSKLSRGDGLRQTDGQRIRFATREKSGKEEKRKSWMKSIEAERIALLECGKPKRRQIDREGITRRWERGYTQQEIADAVKCHTATVRKVLRQEGYEEVFSGSWGSCKVMRRERIMEIIERPDEEQKEPEKNDIFKMATGEPDHDLIYWL